MEDVAKAAGVSRSLVSLVYQSSPKVSAQSRRQVERAAARLGYRPNEMARRLASRTTRTFGVLLNDIHNPFFAEVHDGVQAMIEESGYKLLMGTGDRNSRREAEFISTFLDHRVDGLVMLSPRIPDAELLNLVGSTPGVLVGRAIRSNNIDCVLNNDDSGAKLAIDHLVSLGHSSIAHISGGNGAGAKGRVEGYLAAMRSHGLEKNILVVPGEYTEEAGTRGAEQLLATKQVPTAIFAANDLVAAGAMAALAKAGLKVPRDFSVVGYDNAALARLGLISLTTIEQPLAESGADAVRLLIERVEGERTRPVTHIMEPALVIRGSTARPTRHR